MRKGAVIIEFAIVGPFLAILMLGLLEFSQAIQVQQRLAVASQVGASQVGACQPENIEKAVKASFWGAKGDAWDEKYEKLTSKQIDALQIDTTIIEDEALRVNVGLNFADVALFPPFYFRGRMQAETTVRIQ